MYFFVSCISNDHEDVPVCQHREDVLFVMKKSDTVAEPVIKCRAGRGHPPNSKYYWKFYPEQSENRNRGQLESNDMTSFSEGSIRKSLLSETAVQGNDGGILYSFTTNTPELKSYITAVKAAASSNNVHTNFFLGRLECRAINEMGMQNRPCVYRITGINY